MKTDVAMPRRTTVILLGAILVAVFVAAAVSGCGSGKASTPRCTASQLRGRSLGGGAAVGTVLNTITLQNTGTACRLEGYPSLRVEGVHGLLPIRVIHGGGMIIPSITPAKPRLVKLAHLGMASLVISYEDVPSGDQTSCPVGKAILLRPPGATGWLTVKLETSACNGKLHESAILAGVVTGASSAPVGTSTTAVPETAASSEASAPACRASQLRGKLLDSSGAAGTILFSVTLRNTGAACALKGYTRLRLKRARVLLPTRVVHGGLAVLNSTPKLVKLKHLGRASVLVSYGDVPVGNESSCPHGTVLRLRPPGLRGWLAVRVSTYACARGTLHESPVLAGVRHTT